MDIYDAVLDDDPMNLSVGELDMLNSDIQVLFETRFTCPHSQTKDTLNT